MSGRVRTEARSLPVCPEPVFIIGSPRSGTTILAWSLAQHSAFWTSGELHLLWRLFGATGLDAKLERELAFPGGLLQQEGIDGAEFLEHLGIGLNALLTSRSNGRRWVDQTPVNTLMCEVLSDLFPGARFVHILRDGSEVVNSMLHFQDALADGARAQLTSAGNYPVWAGNFDEACRTWCDSVERAMAFAAEHPDRALTVRYSELVGDPHRSFGEIFTFLGEPHEEGPERYLASVRVNSSFGARTEGRPRQQSWTTEQQRVFAELAGPTMARYGAPQESGTR